MMTLESEQWQPKGISDLEPTAWKALYHSNSACIIAGPGAGKTEFLAQKATYLLETNRCPKPSRILAISFKRDAAENLAARVKKRCKKEDSSRFDSFTFDAFTKSIVDRFNLALPENWRISERYDIITTRNDNEYRSFLEQIRDKNPKHQISIAAIRVEDFKHRILGLHKLSEEKPKTLEDNLARYWFAHQIANKKFDFLLLNRLAEWIIRSTPTVHRAIKISYPFIFVDEFQDTTFAQYDFLNCIFNNSSNSITVVGDNKQRIMLWAGARPDAFKQFISSYSAQEFNLVMNYRSSPGLVTIQQYLARSIEPNCTPSTSGINSEISENFAQIWNFVESEQEYEYIASWIVNDKLTRKLGSTDYAILVRQKPDSFYSLLAPIFNNHGLSLRNEAMQFGKLTMQDIVNNEIFLLVSALIRLTIENKSPIAWTVASNYLNSLFGDQKFNEGVKDLESLLRKLRSKLGEYEAHDQIINDILDETLEYIGPETLRGAFPQYAVGDNLNIFIEALRLYLKYCAESEHSWKDFIRLVNGEDQISLLTIHKSKGLEYDTTIFIGLDDQSWWSYSNTNPEGKATFFVALSRAKQRVIFTYSKGKYGRLKISSLYNLLKQAGIKETLI